MKTLIFYFAFGLSTICFGQTKQRVFLFVHGAWGGGWEYAKVDIGQSSGEISITNDRIRWTL